MALNGKKGRIMVVDDDPLLLRSIKSMLDEYYDVSVVSSGIQALNAMRELKPSLILLDYEMPICDGKATLEKIREDSNLKNIPYVKNSLE